MDLSPDERRSLRAGATLLSGVGLCAALVLLLSGRTLRPRMQFYVDFARTGPLHAGSPLRIAGRDVGEVPSIDLAGPGSDGALSVRATVLVDWSWRHALHTNSEFFITRQGLLGDAFLEVGPPRGQPGPPLSPGDVVVGISPPDLDLFLTRLQRNLAAMHALLTEEEPDARSLVSAISRLDEDTNALPVASGLGVHLARQTDDLASNLLALAPALDELRTDLPAADAIRLRLAHLERDDLPRLQRLEAATLQLRGQVAVLSSVVPPGQRASLEAALGKLQASLARARSTTENMLLLARRVVAGEGTLGALLADRELHDDLVWLAHLYKERPWSTLERKDVPVEE